MGPLSAGANPGPAAMEEKLPNCDNANMVLVNSSIDFLGGSMKVDRELAKSNRTNSKEIGRSIGNRRCYGSDSKQQWLIR